MTRDEIYTPLEEARDEIRRRRADRDLRLLFRTIHSQTVSFIDSLS